jgi:hypothetical protein
MLNFKKMLLRTAYNITQRLALCSWGRTQTQLSALPKTSKKETNYTKASNPKLHKTDVV